MTRNRIAVLSLSLLVAGLFTLNSPGQSPGPGPGNADPFGGQGLGGGRGNNDPQAVQQRIQQIQQQAQQQQLDQMKTQLGATDQEWAAISPLVVRVKTAQRVALTGIGTPIPTRATNANQVQGNAQLSAILGAAAGGNEPPNEITLALQSLRESQDIPGTPVDVLKQKLEVLRRAREKANAELLREEQILRAVLTPRQEAQLMVAGILR